MEVAQPIVSDDEFFFELGQLRIRIGYQLVAVAEDAKLSLRPEVQAAVLPTP